MQHPSPNRAPNLLVQLATVFLGAVVIAGLTTVARTAALSDTFVSLYWPAAGVGFAMLCTQGRAAGWAIALGVGLASSLAYLGTPALIPVTVAASVAGPWLVWRRLQVRFAGTSQPFARQNTMIAFLKAQAYLGAPVSAAIATLGLLLVGQTSLNEQALVSFATYWTVQLCGTVLFAPVAWELLISRTRSGLPRFFSKVGQSFVADWRTAGGSLLISSGVGLLFALGEASMARGLMLLLLPLLALDAIRAAPLTVHLMTLLSGIAVLTASAVGAHMSALPRVQVDHELLLSALTVLLGICTIQILLVTSHERRLALQRIERQADTDPLTNLLSLTGLYRKLEELGDRAEDSTQLSSFEPGAPTQYSPALISVQMTNADSIEQLLGARQSDVIERATSGALTSTAPKVMWSRVSKAHFVGLSTEWAGPLDQLLTKVSFSVVESKALMDNTLGRPIWAVAAVTLETTPAPPVEVIMACLRRTEQAAQESRQIQVTAVDHESGHALKLEAEQAERIRQIIQAKQLVLFAQPIVANVDPSSMKHKYEVLIRLRDAQGHIISPGVFLPVAMRGGLMQMLDMAVMEQTFEWFAKHPKALAELSHCAINLSGPTVASPVIAQRIADGLKLHNLPAHKFTFEITESQAIANPAQATDTIQAIRECGCRVAIDDFGTGVATFDYLKRFDVDYIKIDGAFIKTLLDDPVDRVIVESIVKVAHQMNVRTVAEFVSSKELYGAVTALGVDESQGYAFGAPKPLHEWFGEPD